MKRITKIDIEYTKGELNLILTRALQTANKMRITAIVQNGDVITITGVEEQNMAILQDVSVDTLSSTITTEKVDKRVMKNKGLTKIIMTQLGAGHKVHLDRLTEEVNLAGINLTRGYIRAALKSSLKKKVTEVNPDVFQLTEVYDHSHNKDELVHN